jgi:outer membrane protein assembly factor BamB
VTGASDVFSLGSMLVFAATGHPPFHGANPVETVFMLLREGPDLEGLPDELRPLIESCMQMEAPGRPNPADLQAQLAPHLFGAGSDDSGTASAWLPEKAVSLIESRRGGRPPVQPPPAPPAGPRSGARVPVPPPPSYDPAVPAPVPAQVGAPDTGPVRLAGAKVPIGPGPRVADARAAAVKAPPPEAGLVASWARPRPGVGGADPVAAVSSPLPPEAAATGWRPWRFRMSNDVWGTPSVADDLVYVTSFEVHALDVATGRRRFKTRDVAWSMAVEDGRIHASDGPTLFALEAREGADLWRHSMDGWVYSLKADRGTLVTGTRGGGVQAWEAVSGAKLWEISGCQTDFESSEAGPSVHDGTVYVWQEGRLRALDARTGEERWSYPIGDAASCGGVPIRLTHGPDGHVYVSAGSRVLAVEAASGMVRWHFEAPAVFLSPPAFVPGPAVTGGGVYLADYLGTVYALDAADGRDRWRIATEARASIEPVLVAAGHVHVGSGMGLYTLDAVTGTPKWRFQSGGDIVGAPAVAEGRIHFGSTDHLLYTLKADDGRLRWKLATGGEITGSPVVKDGVVYACSKDRCVYALDAEKGTGTARTA